MSSRQTLTQLLAGGIGSCIAKRFASKGATLALVGKEAKECEEVRLKLRCVL